MKLQTSFLRSRVARRVFALFVVSALVPIMVLGVLSFAQVHQQMAEHGERQLHQEMKSIGVAVIERLTVLDTELSLAVQRISAAESSSDLSGPADLSSSGHGFNQFVFHRPDSIFSTAQHNVALSWLSQPEKAHLSSGKALLHSNLELREQPELYLLRAVDPANLDRGVLAGQVKPEFLWDVPINATTNYCVLNDARLTLFCSHAVPAGTLDAVKLLATENTSGKLSWEEGDETYLGSYWSLFLKPSFHVSDWLIVLGEPQSHVLTYATQFNRIFPPVVGLAVLLVSLLSMVQIRRFMGPLEKLSEGTRRIANHDFTNRVVVDSGDEFEQLADSFNDMSARLGRQFGQLSTMAEIDRLILSTMDADQIVETLLMRAGDVVPCNMVEVVVLDERRHPDATRHINLGIDDSEHLRSAVSLSDDDLEEVLANPTSLVFGPDTTRHYFQPLTQMGATDILVLPVILGETVNAILCLARKDRQPFTKDDIDSGRELADRATVAFSNAAWEDKLYHQAHYDALTDLPNRALLKDRLEQAVNRANRNGTAVAALFLDLDRFKAVNDSLGHAAGDELLRSVAERLTQQVRVVDTVVRFGGDEFIVIVPDLPDDHTLITSISRVCESLLAVTVAPYNVAGHQLSVTTSIGISLFPRDSDNIDELLKNADSAMYHAKGQGRDNYQFYASDLNAAATERLDLENDLRQAVENNELELFYQPQVAADTGRLVGAETLLRWRHPRHGLISPAKFIPIAEETGLINEIGDWVLRTACAQASAWLAGGHPPVRVAVNLSARQFRNPDLAESVQRALADSQLPIEYLELEVTEGTIMTDIDRTIATLQTLNQLGVRLAVDDFGTGYSSLAYLAQFPIQVLKVDQSFVRDVTTNKSVANIVTAIVGLAHSLELSVVAEGVETQEQLDFMRTTRCEEIQGYLFSKPVPAVEFEESILSWENTALRSAAS